MAKQMDYTDKSGNVCPLSYWRPVQINISIADKAVWVVFYGYKDEAARIAKKESVGQKAYSLVGDNFTTYFSAAALDTLNPMKQAYKLAMDTLDTNNNQDSFFKNSLDV